MEALRIEDLSKNFGGVQAILKLSLGVGVGERLAIIGPNGAGKTTLLNLISGELFPTHGRIYISGHEVTEMPRYKRVRLGLGRSFQLNNVFFNLTLLENTCVALQALKSSRWQMLRPVSAYDLLADDARALLEPQGLWEKRDTPISDLSYGQQRQMELILSLATKPKLLLLDEPSAGLSAGESADITNMIQNLGGDITVILVAHDMDLVFGVASRIIVLHYGEIVAEGTGEQISTDPRVREIYIGKEQIA
jgi:branched-chain amino acid transport system ATP-binding protein